MRRAMVAAAVVLLAGAGLLALSGWFITAAAMAGLAGAGATFDVFRPAASVRALAILRTVTRYGERYSGHDATLRCVVTLRRRVLAGLAAQPWPRLVRLRRGTAVNAVTADCDALDGLPLRLVLPAMGGIAAFTGVFALLASLAGWRIALWICGIQLATALVAAAWALPQARRLASEAAAAARGHVAAMLDLVTSRDELAVHGLLPAQTALALGHDATARSLILRLDRIERGLAASLDLSRALAAAGGLALAAQAVARGEFGPGIAALCFFTALALAEVTAPLRRAVADYGRIADAASRIAPVLAEPTGNGGRGGQPDLSPDTPLPLRIDDLALQPGQVLVLTGPSGCGKTTLLNAIAGLTPPHGHRISLNGIAPLDWPEPALRAALAMVTQRPALIAGTLRDNLMLAAPDADDAQMMQALAATRLDHLREGLSLRLGPGGEGLSGGEKRRLALARALLRRPALLVLDEPTEGLDDATAQAVLQGIQGFLPRAAIVMATHRRATSAGNDFLMRLD